LVALSFTNKPKTMTKSELEKIAKAFIKGKNPKNAKGCFVTPDGSVFYRDYSGMQYARAAAGNPKDVLEFDENGEIVTPKDANAERVKLISKIAGDSSNKYRAEQLANLSNEGLRKLGDDIVSLQKTDGQDDLDIVDDAIVVSKDDDAIDLDKMKHGELVELLKELDPTHEVTKETKAQLKDLIVAANTLTDYDDKRLIAMIKAIDPDMMPDTMPDEDVTKVLNNDELKAIVLNLRDEVELDQDINDKMFALEASGAVDATNNNEDNDQDVDN